MSTLKLKGKIHFNPEDKTNKHILQSSWKVIAMVLFDNDDFCSYYSWFIKKRYNIVLNKPLRNTHITFINDRIDDLMGENDEIKRNNWEEIKEKYENVEVEVELNLDCRSDGKHWYFKLLENAFLMDLRKEIGLGDPYYGFHVSIGYATHFHLEHSQYIVDSIKNNYIK
jgi:hypothetical protein